MLPYDLLSISLADCISSGGSRICFLMLAMSVFSGQTRRDGGFGNRGNAEHGTKHVLHVGALTPQSFRQMAGGYLICRWISDIKDSQPPKNTSEFPSNRMLTRPRSSIHPHSIIQATMMSMIRIFQTEGPWMSGPSGSPLLVPGFRLAEFFGWPGSHNMQDMRNFRTTKCTSNWTSRSWRCKLARFCFCSWTTALAKSYRFVQKFSGTEQLDSSESSETNPQTLGSVSHDPSL